jgi:SAM-dependent methyltransferase
MSDREPTSHERMSGQSWDASYHDGPAPWDIGGPQPAIARRISGAELRGPVLDAGCGSGENTLLVASLGLPVLGVDVAETALAIARRSAKKRQISAEFASADAFDLARLDRTFNSVIDSGLLHTFDRDERRRYAVSLAAVAEPGAMLYLLCFSNEGQDAGPHPITKDDLHDAFRTESGWKIVSIEPDRVMTRYHDENGAPAWFATIRRV